MKTTKGVQSGSLNDTDSIEPLSILPGPGIFTTRNSIDNSYTISALAGIDNTVSIKSGPGIVSSFDSSTNEYFIDTAPPITRHDSKPIFMVGLPISTPFDTVEQSTIHLREVMSDYHVIVLRNSTDDYTAKLFSEQSTETMDIKDIKRYIDQKMKS